jgi:site-specific recombinase XerD
MEHGKVVRSRWNTRTKNLEAAERFAQDNRERILTAYHLKHDSSQQFFEMLSDFYREGSAYMTASANRGRLLGEKTRKEYHAFIIKTLIPFFKEHNVRTFDDVTKPVVETLQDLMLDLGKKPQTIWRLLCCLRQMFDFFVAHGTTQSNPFRGIIRIRPKSDDVTARGCYEIDTLKDVFNKPWSNATNLLLCLIIYIADMRNSEIKRLRVKDIIPLHQAYFFDINESKTKNGIRIIPIHPAVYAKLQNHIAKNNLAPEDFLFEIRSSTFKKACTEMGRLMQKTPEELAALNITFYSGRCFWKTAMNVEKLGEVEEYFMGHKVSNDVAKLYNHKDKTGRKNIAAKAKAVFKVLDKYLGLNCG